MHHPIVWVECSLDFNGMVQMVVERLKELEEFVALVELELLVYSVGILETMMVYMWSLHPGLYVLEYGL